MSYESYEYTTTTSTATVYIILGLLSPFTPS
jgi:hypothetical protein